MNELINNYLIIKGNMLSIQGFGDNLTVNNIRIGDLSPAEHEKIELDKGGQNYRPLENVVVSHVQDSSTLICRKPSDSRVKAYIEEELIDYWNVLRK